MATEPSPQRAYRAACPQCGAPVEFRSAASAFAVCSYCRSTVVREGDALRRIGESAELFDDHTPLQLGVAGRYQGAPFTLVGRLQYGYREGTWNEWHALFDSDPEHPKSGWLSEDNGRYVLAFDLPLAPPAPPLASLRPGATVSIDGQPFSVASRQPARLIAAQGELPSAPDTSREFAVVDLRSTRDEVGTLVYGGGDAAGGAGSVVWSVGRSVALAELALTGLADGSEKTLRGRSIACPNCGAALEIRLETTQSIVCHQCRTVIDLRSKAQGEVGGDLAHYRQRNGSEPQIPLGSTGTLALGPRGPLPWQVVGYVERIEVDTGEDDQSTWREYLLYHRAEGFAFLVDAEDGWSWSVPITGVPERFGDAVKYQGVLYRPLYTYTGQITYVLGEFYWQLTRDQRTRNTDYRGTGAAGAKRLNREETGGPGGAEIVWSAGETLDADTVVKAFGLAPEKRAALQRDALPTAFNAAGKLAKVFVWLFIIAVVLMIVMCSSRDDCDALRSRYGESSQEYRSCLNGSGGGSRTSGGSFGGFSSGGGHK